MYPGRATCRRRVDVTAIVKLTKIENWLVHFNTDTYYSDTET